MEWKYREVPRIKDVDLAVPTDGIQVFKAHAEDLEWFETGILGPVKHHLA